MCNNRQAITIASNIFLNFLKLFFQYSLLVLIVVKLFLTILKWFKMSLKAETKQTFPNSKNHLVQNSCFLYNNPIKKLQTTGLQRVPPAGPSIAIINKCNKKQLFWLVLLFFLFYFFQLWLNGFDLSFWFVGRVGTWNLQLRSATPPPPKKKKKQIGGRGVYYCGPNIRTYRTDTNGLNAAGGASLELLEGKDLLRPYGVNQTILRKHVNVLVTKKTDTDLENHSNRESRGFQATFSNKEQGCQLTQSSLNWARDMCHIVAWGCEIHNHIHQGESCSTVDRYYYDITI